MSRGEIVFKDVSFAYPKRSTKQVLSGLNFEAHPGKTIALVGSSGCGIYNNITHPFVYFFYN